MDQPVPKISAQNIDNLISRDFPNSKLEVQKILNLYKSTSSPYRVFAAILKLSNGDIVKLKQFVSIAINDYRDVIARAEYPNYSDFFNKNSLNKTSKEKLIQKDWQEYCLWLNKEK